jgi:LDH2 family malate/lactate/ureidoglycolate dehydrogenase
MKSGVPAAEAEIVAGLLVRSDLSGVETHGVTRLPIYIQRLQNGYDENEYLIPMWKPDERSNRFSNALG